MTRQITAATTLRNLKKEAKRWLKELRAQSLQARKRFLQAYPNGSESPVLRDVQHALAREYGHRDWIALKTALDEPGAAGEGSNSPICSTEEYERLANDLVQAYDSQDASALERLNAYYNRSFSFDDLWAEVWRRVYAVRQRSGRGTRNHLELSEAQNLIAQDVGFGSWEALTRSAATRTTRVPPYSIDSQADRIAPRRRLDEREWNELIEVMRERRISALEANGWMTDEVLARVAELEHVTALSLGGSRQLSDDGLQHLARMPQLQQLQLNEYPGGRLTDRGLQVLQHLPRLRTFEMTWQRGITDAGVAHLRGCDQLERVNLMGSPTGDGAIEALQHKPRLHAFDSGRLVTDAGLRLLRNFPRLKTRHDDALGKDGLAHLLIDGPFTDQGLAGLCGLEGVGELDLFWHAKRITSDGFAHLVQLPNLESLGADGRLSDDGAMRHIASMPRLRRLRAQESVAGEEGFEALSRSRTLAHLWGRECPNFGSRGFVALSKMPTLQSLGIGCRNVSDQALSRLPLFPALRELTPIGVTDAGFAHIGRCRNLERLTCMYCRETTDAATEHIAGLRLKYYYAGLTLITDRSLEILGRMSSLEQIDLYECKRVTDAGLHFLVGLPQLREIHLDGLPGVTLEGTRIFPVRVKVSYST